VRAARATDAGDPRLVADLRAQVALAQRWHADSEAMIQRMLAHGRVELAMPRSASDPLSNLS
jgi:hypothetical protein